MCLNVINGFVHELRDCAEAEYFLVANHHHQVGAEELKKLTLAEYRREAPKITDVLVYVITPKPVISYLRDVVRVVEPVAKVARVEE